MKINELSSGINNIADQFEDLYSRWSLLDKAGKDAQLAEMMGRAQRFYQFLVVNYGSKGYLTQDEYNRLSRSGRLVNTCRRRRYKLTKTCGMR